MFVSGVLVVRGASFEGRRSRGVRLGVLMQTLISTKQRMEWGMSARGTVVGVTGVAIEQVTVESLGGAYVVARP